MTEADYIPALRFRWLTRLYDPIVRVTTREATFKRALLAQVHPQPGQGLLDVGCGTGTLAIALKQAEPRAEVVGLDGDPAVLSTAASKASAAGTQVTWQQSLSTHMPFADGQFDTVVSSLFFHHLQRDVKLTTLREIHRVLRPAGELHIADWGQASNAVMRFMFLTVQFLDGFATTRDHVNGLMPEFVARAGFVDVIQTRTFDTPVGTPTLWRAHRP